MKKLIKMVNAKKSLSLLILIFVYALNARAKENNLALDSANAAYSKGNYSKAISIYESILNKGQEAPELYFNLGNAYYKTNSIGLAILNYERAKKLRPNDDDININLKIAYQKIEDKIDTAPQLFLTQWKTGLVDLMGEKSWSILCILLAVAALLLFGLYISSHAKNIKQLGFFGGIILLISAAVTFFVAEYSYQLSKNSTDAIIVSPSLTVVSSPNEKGTKLFILHEGTKVGLMQEDAEWMEIRIANGNVGWVKKQNIIPI